MKRKIPILILLCTGMVVLASCSSGQGEQYYKDAGQQYVSAFQAPNRTSYAASYEGFFLDQWDSIRYPSTVSDDYSTDVANAASPLLAVSTLLNTDNYEDVYNYMEQTFVAADNPDLFIKVEKQDNGDVVFSVNNSNLRLFLYGFTNGTFDRWQGASATARWNVYVTYDAYGQLVSEHAYTSASYTSDRRANVDVKVTYSQS